VPTNKLVIKQSDKALLVETGTLYFLLIVFLLLALIIFSLIVPLISPIVSVYVIVFVFFLIITLALLLALMICVFSKKYWNKREYVITPETIMDCEGMFSSNCVSYELKGMTSMEVHQTALGKKFNYGNLIVRFMGGGSLLMKDIPAPEILIVKIRELISKKEIEEENNDN